MRDLQSKRVLITGGGNGLGREIAREFSRLGALVIVTDRDLRAARQTASMIRREGGEARAYPMDVAQPESVAQVRMQIHSDIGPIDILVDNAGIVHGGAFVKVPLQRHLQTSRVNSDGPMIVTHTFLPDLITRPEAHLVNIVSASAFIALPYGASYAASKWSILGFTESIREELREEGYDHVKVTAMCPSYITTGLFHGVSAPWLIPFLTPSEVAQATINAVRHNRAQVLMPWLVKLVPFGRATQPRFLFRRLCEWLGVYRGMQGWRGHADRMSPATTAGVDRTERDSFVPANRISEHLQAKSRSADWEG